MASILIYSEKCLYCNYPIIHQMYIQMICTQSTCTTYRPPVLRQPYLCDKCLNFFPQTGNKWRNGVLVLHLEENI